MQQFLLALLAPALLLSSCGQESPKKPAEKPKKEVKLNLSAEVQPAEGRAMDYKLVADQVKATLENKTSIEVRTYIFEGNNPTPIFNDKLVWKVGADKKTLKFDDQVHISTTPSKSSKLRLVAVIGDVSGAADQLTVYSSYTQGQVLPVLSGNQVTKINVPYILESTLEFDGAGNWEMGTSSSKGFKPYGHFLRVKINNKTNKDVTIKGLFSVGLLAESATLSVLASGNKVIGRKEYDSPMELKLSKKIVVPAGKTSTESVLLWVPKIGNKNSYSLDLVTEENQEFTPYYSVMNVTKDPNQLKNGAIYTTVISLHKTEFLNPLSLLSEDVMNREGTDFVDLRHKFKLHDLSIYNGPGKVGYFRLNDGYNRFFAERTYPSTGNIKWHLPDEYEWNSIRYNPEQEFLKGYVDYEGTIPVKIGLGAKKHYWKTVAYQIHVPEAARSSYYYNREWPKAPILKNDHSFYALSYGKTNASNPNFPAETTNDNRFAFRYSVYEDRLVITCSPVGIKDIKVKDLPNHPVFYSPGTVKRTLPFYGISKIGPDYMVKDTIGGKPGNVRIVDFVTGTKHTDGIPKIASFSACRCYIRPYDLPHAFPVALFKEVK